MIIACIANALVAIMTFFLYLKSRMATREMPPDTTDEEHAKRLAHLDRLESRYQAIHFITLALFVLYSGTIL